MIDIKTIILDLGNVVFDISFEKMYGYWAERNGIAVEQLKERLVFDEMYCKFERGELTPEQYRDYAIGELGIELDHAEFDRGWNNIYLDVLPGIDELVKALHGHHRLGVLTNTNVIHAQKWRKRYASILEYFDHVFCSYEMGARKPEPEIYRRMLEYLETDPGSVIFFDDKAENVQVAKACGINAFQISSSAHIISYLENNDITFETKERGMQ